MAIFSKEICKEKLKTWMAAEDAIATGQSYQIGTRMLTRASLKQVREQIEYWAKQLSLCESEEKYGGRNRIYQFVPKDT